MLSFSAIFRTSWTLSAFVMLISLFAFSTLLSTCEISLFVVDSVFAFVESVKLEEQPAKTNPTNVKTTILAKYVDEYNNECGGCSFITPITMFIVSLEEEGVLEPLVTQLGYIKK